MITFLRRIRQKLLAEHKFSQYVMYALGEIILVVVGILLALAVNNWNQEAKDHRLGDDYLRRIHRDLVQDTVNFRGIIAHNGELREEIKGLLQDLYEGVDSVEQVQAMTAIYDEALDQVFAPNDNTYQGMVSTGALGFIRDPALKEAIVELYGEYDQRGALLSGMGQWLFSVAAAVDIQTDFIKFNGDAIDLFTTPAMLNERDFAFLNDPSDEDFKLLVRAITATAWSQAASNAYYEELLISCQRVLILMEDAYGLR